FAADTFAFRLVERFMADAEGGGARRVDVIAVGDEQGVLTQNGRQHRLDGLGGHGREDGADGGAASVGGHQDRRLFARKAALGCLSAPPASLAPKATLALTA